jgi:oligopeptide transport system permease protein
VDAALRLARNRLALAGAIIVVLLTAAAVFAPLVSPSGYEEGDLLNNYAPPGREHWLGADFPGRDVLSRLIYGARVSLTVGFVGAFTSFVIGMAYGSLSGYYGGRVDNILMRIVDVMYAIPTLLLIILIMVYFRSAVADVEDLSLVVRWLRAADSAVGGLLAVFVGIGVSSWMTMARLARGGVLSMKESEFVMAARAVGASDRRIVSRSILPTSSAP